MKKSKKHKKHKKHKKNKKQSSRLNVSDDISTRPRRDASRSSLETEAERRARRKAKKEAKAKNLFGGYSNEDNPFGDPNLHQAFVWKKKRERPMTKDRGAQEA